MPYPKDGEFKVVIAGGRDYLDYPMLRKVADHVLSHMIKTRTIVIVCGMARGADALGERYAKERGYKVEYHPADWDLHGKSAGYRRNEEMAKASNATLAFWDSQSKGTKHMIDLTLKHKNRLKIVKYKVIDGKICYGN